MKRLYILCILSVLMLLLCSCSPDAILAQRVEPAGEAAAAQTEPTGVFESVGPWHLAAENNDLSLLSELCPGYGEFSATMEIRSSGQISWYIGCIGGFGTYTREGNTLKVHLTQATKEVNTDPVQWDMSFDILTGNGQEFLRMDYKGTEILWSYGDSGDIPARGCDEELPAAQSTPGPDTVCLVNLRGDTVTAYKLADGSYMDRENRRYYYDGIETWTDENGVIWNEALSEQP